MTNAQPRASGVSSDEPREPSRAARLAVGIGCRRGVSVEQIEAALGAALGGYSMHDVRCIATLDAKAQEPALVALCARHGLPLVTFGADAVNAYAAGHASTARSAAARQHVGAWGVCEPCALLAAPGGALVVPKLTREGVTVAVAALPAALSTNIIHDNAFRGNQP